VVVVLVYDKASGNGEGRPEGVVIDLGGGVGGIKSDCVEVR